MRIITGSKRGKKLVTLEGEQVRPTTDRVKESLFNILQFQLEGRKFLDLFAGSGQIGLEALSRGAALCVFVDSAKESIRVVEKNIQSTGLGDRAKVVGSDFAAYLRGSREMFDIAFLDPPYRTGLLEQALPLVAQRMNPGGVILCRAPQGRGAARGRRRFPASQDLPLWEDYAHLLPPAGGGRGRAVTRTRVRRGIP